MSLGEFESKRTITFTPPDGEFELMRYRASAASQPFRLVSNIVEAGKSKLVINLKVPIHPPSGGLQLWMIIFIHCR